MFRTTALVLALCAAACGAAQAQPVEGRLKRIAVTKTINIAWRADATPFSFAGEDKQPAGYSIELCKQVVRAIEQQLKISALKVNWVPVTVQNRFETVARGRADMECGSSTVTLSRYRQVDFSSFTFLETSGVMVKTSAGINGVADLAGKNIAVVGGTTNERALRLQMKARNINATVMPLKSSDEGFAALTSGKADAFVSDKLLLIGAASKAGSASNLGLLNEDLSFEPYAIALPRNESALRLAVNTGLSQVYGSGEIAQIYRKWFAPFGDPSPMLQSLYIFGALPE
jgi:ABC-type amino acid transport substrate-binding protein